MPNDPHINQEKSSWLLCGVTSGLGLEFLKLLSRKLPDDSVIGVGRNKKKWLSVAGELSKSIEFNVCDFSKENSVDELLLKLSAKKFHRMVYFAGGGPFGAFAKKQFKDHKWAFETNFLAPAKLVHWGIVNELCQICVIGSSVAEEMGDFHSASYSASKHALKGLITSIQLEKVKTDARLYSPGYLDTPMLPPNSWPRQKEVVISNPKDVAQHLLLWLLNADFAHQNYKWPSDSALNS